MNETMLKFWEIAEPTKMSEAEWTALCEQMWQAIMDADPSSISIELFGAQNHVDAVEN